MRILYAYLQPSRFVDIDREALRTRHEVEDWTGRPSPARFPAALAAVRRSDVVVAWFAGWHALLPALAAWALRRPLVVITGGYDVANEPQAGYGMQTRAHTRAGSRFILRRAARLLANSDFGRDEALRAVPSLDGRIEVVHHGVPDLVGEAALEEPKDGALTVGVVDRRNLARKGLLAFAQAALRLPDRRFVLAGRWEGDAVEELRAVGADNLELVGWVDDEALAAHYRSAAVYVQASVHEGFGMAVAEAMLAGCVPVVTASGALPEVVGDAGVTVASQDPDELAAAVERALAAGPDARARARHRVLERFHLEGRREGLLRVVESATGG